MTAQAGRHSRVFLAEPDHIDELGHVNNAVWVQWIQEIATSHWNLAARPEDAERYFWVVVRHEIDYRGNIALGESAVGETWIPDPPQGAKSDRLVLFKNEQGRVLVSSRTSWALMEQESKRLARVRPEIIAAFRAESG